MASATFDLVAWCVIICLCSQFLLPRYVYRSFRYLDPITEHSKMLASQVKVNDTDVLVGIIPRPKSPSSLAPPILLHAPLITARQTQLCPPPSYFDQRIRSLGLFGTVPRPVPDFPGRRLSSIKFASFESAINYDFLVYTRYSKDLMGGAQKV